MDNIKIGQNIVRVAINDDPGRIIEFNPNDIVFIEKFYRLVQEFKNKETDYRERAEKLDANQAFDENNLPANIDDRLTYLREICEFVQTGIDRVFGEGTSEKVFQGHLDLNMIGEFFEGLVPFIQKAREGRMDQYLAAKKSGKKVMK